MSIETKLTELMIDTIQLAAPNAINSYGKRTYAAASSITNCRVQTGTDKVLDATGAEVISAGKVYVPGHPTLTVNHKLTLPDTTTPPIISFERKSDERGSHHTVIYYGR